MLRRRLLTTAGTALVAGTAGCSGVLGGGGDGCPSPENVDRNGLLPDEGNFTMSFEDFSGIFPEGTHSPDGDIGAVYYDGQRNEYSVAVGVFDSNADANEATKHLTLDPDDQQRQHLGHVTVGEYVIVGRGEDRTTIEKLLAQAEDLSRACVDSKIEFE